VIYLDVVTPAQARAEFDQLFDSLERRVCNQRIFEAVKLGHAPHSRARKVAEKAEPRREGSGETVETAIAACGYCGTEWLASSAAPTCPACQLSRSAAHGERR